MKHIPTYNSSLSYMNNGFGFKDEDTHICAYCGLEEEHHYEGGKCVCGLGDTPSFYYDYDEVEDDFVKKDFLFAIFL